MTRSGRTLSRIAVVCLVAVLPGCGGGSSSPSTPTTVPPAPVTTVVAQGTFHLGDPATALATGQVCDILAFVPFTTAATGTVAITVSWSHASNDLDIGLARGSCTCNTALASQCDEVASSDSTTAKPETLNINSLAAGAYTLAVLNNGPGTEAGSYQVLLTH